MIGYFRSENSKKAWLMVILILMVSVGQTFSKIGALQVKETGIFFNIYLFVGYVILLIRGVIWVFILNTVKLSLASPLISSTYIIVLWISYYYFGEEVNVINLLGCFLIMGGVIMVLLGEKAIRSEIIG